MKIIVAAIILTMMSDVSHKTQFKTLKFKKSAINSPFISSRSRPTNTAGCLIETPTPHLFITSMSQGSDSYIKMSMKYSLILLRQFCNDEINEVADSMPVSASG